MDGIKLNKWKADFEAKVKALQMKYKPSFSNKQFSDIYTISLDESEEWELKLNSDLSSEIKEELQKAFMEVKPEDSI